MERYEKLVKIASLLDAKHSLRLIVLLAPGVLATKLASYSEPGASVRGLAAAILGVGLVIYAMWGFIKKKLLREPEIEQSEPQPEQHREHVVTKIIPGKLHAELINELLKMCDGDAAMVLQLVNVESEMHPRETYLAAIEYAHRRKTLQVSHRSGS